MMKLKVCFVGVGSIAQRHIVNLYDVCKKREIQIKMDVFRSGNGKKNLEILHTYIEHIYTEIQNVPNDYDIIFITNPTDLHMETLRLFQQKGKNFFIEKPITTVSKINELLDFQFRKNSVYYVACPLRYMKIMQYIKDEIDKSQIYSIRCISSSYLPDWRPGTDYRNVYSAKKAGGGVAIDLIHEWDYLQYLFGMPKRVYKIGAKKSDLEIESEDIAVYIAELEQAVIELHLDYFGRKTIRKMELYRKDDTLECDLIEGTIKYLSSKKEISFQEERDSYQKRELETFLDMIENRKENINSPMQAYQTLKLTQGDTV